MTKIIAPDGIGFAELLSVNGTDSDIAAAARASTGALPGVPPDITAKRDTSLVIRLMKDGHTSPFEHCSVKLLVRAPLFVSTQWARHRFSSFNVESGRYTELKDEFYVPAPDQIRIQPGKAMDYEMSVADADVASAAHNEIRSAIAASRRSYERLLELGVAREQARIVLPVAQYTTFVWSVNLLGLMNFLRLRDDSHAQAEIRWYAENIRVSFLAPNFPVTHAAFMEFWTQGSKPGMPGIV